MRIIFSVLVVFCTLSLAAQPTHNNPYSRFGLGEFLPQTFAHQAGMGHLGAAINNPFSLNPMNPAASGFLETTDLAVGTFAERNLYETDVESLKQWAGNLSYLNLGMALKSPINKALDQDQSPWNFGLVLGIAPYTDVSYNITTDDTLPDLGRVVNNFQGDGGTFKLRWAGAARYKQTAFGVELGWLFGNSQYTTTTSFPDSISTFQNNFRDDIAAKGLTFRLGAQHNFTLKMNKEAEVPERWITVGVFGNGAQNLSSISESLRMRSRGQLSNGRFSFADTLSYQEEQKYDLTLPSEVAFGLTYVDINKLKVGAEVAYGAWENYRNDARPTDNAFQNTFSVSAGVEWIPDITKGYKRYSNTFRYRLGGYYRQDPRVINGESVTDYGLTIGLGIPARMNSQLSSRYRTFVQTAFEIGQLGSGTAISNTYYRISLGFSLNDNSWFFKRRFE